jgi:hypothetical protein
MKVNKIVSVLKRSTMATIEYTRQNLTIEHQKYKIFIANV